MGVRIINDTDNNIACLYCSTSGWAFGPVFEGDDPPGDAVEFLGWLSDGRGVRLALALGMRPAGDGTDPRCWTDDDLERLYNLWHGLREAADEITLREPTDDEVANGYGMEGGIGYASEPAMSEHDWRL